MIKLAVHLEANFRNASFAERWQVAADLGYQGCEFVWRNHDLDEASRLRRETGMRVACMGGTTGGQPGGNRPVLVWPEDRERLAADVATAIDAARALECDRLVMVVGNRVAGWDDARLRAEAIASLKSVAPALERAGVTAVIEPLNSRVDHKGCYCDTSAEGFAIVREVSSPNVKVLYDVYHMQIMEGNLIQTIRDHREWIGHYHIAGVPGRHEPLGGEVNFAAVLEAIDETGYDGFVGLEYSPSGDARTSLQQIKNTYAPVG